MQASHYRRNDVDTIFYRMSIRIVGSLPSSAVRLPKKKLSIPRPLLPHHKFHRRSLKYLQSVMTIGRCRSVHPETTEGRIGRASCTLVPIGKSRPTVVARRHRPPTTMALKIRLHNSLHLLPLPDSPTRVVKKRTVHFMSPPCPPTSHPRLTIRHCERSSR